MLCWSLENVGSSSENSENVYEVSGIGELEKSFAEGRIDIEDGENC
jgi:hypothetical protein